MEMFLPLCCRPTADDTDVVLSSYPQSANETVTGEVPADYSGGTPLYGSSKSAFGRTMEEKKHFGFATSGEDGCSWINDLIVRLFPRIDHYLQQIVQDVINPMIDSQLPNMLQGQIKLDSVKLEEALPNIGPIAIREGDANSDAIVIDLGIDLDARMDVSIKVTKFHIGIKALLIHGVLTVAMRPAVLKPPFFGGLEIYFVNPPDIDAEFSGTAEFANIPGIRGMVRRAINMAFVAALVIPARLGMDLIEDDQIDVADLRFPDPLGVLQVTLLNGKKLVAKDDSFFRKNVVSDPYVVVRLGSDSWSSPVIKRTVNPVWKKNHTALFTLYDSRQTIDFVVWDEDTLSRDDLMGKSEKYPAKDMYEVGKKKEYELPLQLKSENAGSLRVATEWFVLSADKPTKPQHLYVTAKISDVRGLPAGSMGPFTVEVHLGKEETLKSAPNKPMDHLALKPIEGTLQSIIRKMHGYGMKPDAIADCMDLREEHINYILTYEKDPKLAAKHLLQASIDRQKSLPRFDEVLKTLVAWTEAKASSLTEIIVKDGKKRKVASFPSFPLEEILKSPGMEKNGPFRSSGIELQGSIRCRWLVPS